MSLDTRKSEPVQDYEHLLFTHVVVCIACSWAVYFRVTSNADDADDLQACTPRAYFTPRIIQHHSSSSAFEYKLACILVGGYCGQFCLQVSQLLIRHYGYAKRTLRYPRAAFLCVGVTALLSVTGFLSLNPKKQQRLLDYYGVETDYFNWVDWLFTVPSLFYLVSTMETRKNTISGKNVLVQFAASGGIFSLFLINLHLPEYLAEFLFFIAHALMGVACVLLLKNVFAETDQIHAKFGQIALLDGDSMDHNHIKIANSKRTCAIFVVFFCTSYTVVYWIGVIGWLSTDNLVISLRLMNFCVKAIFCQVILDCYNDILDPSFFVIQNQRKNSEASRLSFLRYVFHEVRVPLNSVVLGLQLLAGSSHVRKSSGDTINLMKESTSRMADTLNNFLDLHKLEQGKLELEYDWFDPSQMMQNVIDTYRKELSSGGVSITSILQIDVPDMIFGDQFRLEHALGNLLSSAIDLSEDGGEIVIKCSYESIIKNFVTFSVTDYGSRVPFEHKQQVFDVFKNLRGSSTARASSFGLAISKKIVELHNGVIDFKSYNKGEELGRESGDNESSILQGRQQTTTTSFFFSIDASKKFPGNDINENLAASYHTDSDEEGEGEEGNTKPEDDGCIRLPTCDSSKDITQLKPVSAENPTTTKDRHVPKEKKLFDHQQDEDYLEVQFSETNSDSKSGSRSSINNPFSSRPMKILIVDDVAINRRMLEMILRKEGYPLCEQCEDGRECIELVSKNGLEAYDLIFMDNLMNDMGGLVTTKKLREMGFPNLIIGLTGLTDEKKEFETIGADCVLNKPFKMEHLKILLGYIKRFGCKTGQQPSVKSCIYKAY